MKKGVIVFISIIGFLLIVLGVYFSFVDISMKANIYLIEFNSNGGTFIEEQYVETGNYILKPPNPKKEGFTFLFWKYNDKEYDFSTKVNQDMTLSAVWEQIDKNQKKYTISFDTNGGNFLDNIEVLENVGIINLPIPKRDGYVFKN